MSWWLSNSNPYMLLKGMVGPHKARKKFLAPERDDVLVLTVSLSCTQNVSLSSSIGVQIIGFGILTSRAF